MLEALNSIPEEISDSCLRVLLIEDDEYYARMVRKYLNKPQSGFNVTWVNRLSTAMALFDYQSFDIILLDLWLPDASELEGFYAIRAKVPDTCIVVLTNNQDGDVGLEAVRNGAQDFLVKEHISTDSIARAARYSLERIKARESQLRLEAINDFMAMIAHDLRIPLLAIDRAMKLLQKGDLTPEQHDVLVTGVRVDNSKLIDLITRLLDVYRMEAKVCPLQIRSLAIEDVLTEAIARCQTMHDQRIKVSVSSKAEIYPKIEGDKASLVKMFEQLLDNAIRYGGIEKVVQFRIEAQDDGIQISVADFGPGIPNRVKRRLAARMWHGMSGTTYVAHGGLGLYFCQRVMDRHDGGLTIVDNPDGGTIVSAMFPTLQKSV